MQEGLTIVQFCTLITVVGLALAGLITVIAWPLDRDRCRGGQRPGRR